MGNTIRYIALIGDLVDSKNVENRESVQENLERIFKRINYRRKDIASKYTITLGDEFQALYSNAGNLFRDLIQIKTGLFPVNVRVSIAVGEIATSIKKTAIGMDGTAFHKARHGIGRLKKTKGLLYLDTGKKSGLNEGLVELVDHNMKKWNYTRYQIMELMLSGTNVKDISGKLEISERAVYKSITAGALLTFEKIFNSLSDELNNTTGID